MKLLHKVLSKIILACVLTFSAVPALCETQNDKPITVAQNDDTIIVAQIGENGTWATAYNKQLLIDSLTDDFNKFNGNESPIFNENYIPIEAKVGISFANALAIIATILDESLVPFTMIFIALAYGFWLFFEAYTIISGQNKTEEKVHEMLKQGLKVGIWIAILKNKPINIFTTVIQPILSVGTIISDTILNAVTKVISSGNTYPDTCGAIHKYVENHLTDATTNFSPDFTADLMCLPTRISSFCYAGIQIGRKWISEGFGENTLSVFFGIAFIIGFIYLAWKFAFIAFGVIADLFLSIIMFPFTAIAETTAKTTYKGIAGDIFNGFLKLFSAESLKAQISRFVDATWHFITMSIIISICIALLSIIFIFDAENNAIILRTDKNDWEIMLVAALTWWLAKKSSDLANEFGGKISYEIGTGIKDDVKNLWSSTKKGTKTVIKIIRNIK